MNENYNLIKHPFGSGEGAREDPQNFLVITSSGIPPFIELGMKDLTIRVISGRKGSGKTYYSRIMERSAVDWDDVLCILPSPPAKVEPTLIKTFTKNLGDVGELSSIWQDVWRKAFYHSFLSQIFYEFSPSVPSRAAQYPSIERARKKYREQFNEISKPLRRNSALGFKSPRCIYTSVAEICNSCLSVDHYHNFLHNSAWNDLIALANTVLAEMPPVVYFLDAIDDDFRHAPAAYLDCQKGLYYACKDIANNMVLKKRLIITITLRDLVYSAVISNENRLKNMDSPDVLQLNWTREAIQDFFEEKIISLKEKLFEAGEEEAYRKMCVSPNAGNPKSEFFGGEKIYNKIRGVEEDVLDYVIRHTRNCPREVVEMGNEIARSFYANSGSREVEKDLLVRKAVASKARDIASETLSVCANFLAASIFGIEYVQDTFDSEATYVEKQNAAGKDTFETEMSGYFKEHLKSVLVSLNKDVFTLDDFYEAQEGTLFQMDGVSSSRYKMDKMEHVLWNQGLIGFREFSPEGAIVKDHFYTDSSISHGYLLPTNHKIFVLHPCLIDYLAIQPKNAQPVGAKIESV